MQPNLNEMHDPRIYHADVQEVQKWSIEKLRDTIPLMRQEFLAKIAEAKQTSERYRALFVERSDEIARLRKAEQANSRKVQALTSQLSQAAKKAQRSMEAGYLIGKVVGRTSRVETVANHLL